MNNNEMNYHEQVKINQTKKLREVMETLPIFCKSFFLGMNSTMSARTKLGYALDLRIFFDFLQDNNPTLKTQDVRDFKIEILDQVTKDDIEEYMEYLTYYEKNGKAYTNDEQGKARKIASLKSFYNYYYTAEKITKNPASMVKSPKIHEKEIIRLDPNEVAILLEAVENGDNLTENEKRYHNKTKIRDLAILTLLLGTGIRVSECVGLNLNNVDFDNCGIKIQRKGGYEAVVYFGDEVEDALQAYLLQRNEIIPLSGHEDALFLSMQNKRMTVRAVEKMVKKYAEKVTSLKKITPHKLRSTYGTSLYQETGDIYLVADVLGHKNVDTTRKHYAAQSDSRRRMARNAVKLRSDAD